MPAQSNRRTGLLSLSKRSSMIYRHCELFVCRGFVRREDGPGLVLRRKHSPEISRQDTKDDDNNSYPCHDFKIGHLSSVRPSIRQHVWMGFCSGFAPASRSLKAHARKFSLGRVVTVDRRLVHRMRCAPTKGPPRIEGLRQNHLPLSAKRAARSACRSGRKARP